MVAEKELGQQWKKTHTRNIFIVLNFLNTITYIVHNTLQIRRKYSFSQEIYSTLNTFFLQSLIFSFFSQCIESISFYVAYIIKLDLQRS